jgi:MurNAc alpha-1-phosphate uridylyltransferase
MKGMILAAGLGTRLKPFTDKHPKALASVNGKTLLQRNIEYLKSFGVDDILINVHHFADQIIEHIELHRQFGINITISDETNEVLETGGGLKKASWFFSDGQPFVLMNVDILTNMNLHDLVEYHQSHHALVTLAISDRKSSRCFLWNKNHELCGWRNKQTGEERISREDSNLVEKSFSGIHIIDPLFFKYLTQEGKFSIVDTYLEAARSERIIGFDHSGCHLLDVGKPESITLAESIFS